MHSFQSLFSSIWFPFLLMMMYFLPWRSRHWFSCLEWPGANSFRNYNHVQHTVLWHHWDLFHCNSWCCCKWSPFANYIHQWFWTCYMQRVCFVIPYDCQGDIGLRCHTMELTLFKHFFPYNLLLSTRLHHVPSWWCIRSWISCDPYLPLNIWKMYIMPCTWGNFYIVSIPWRGKRKYWIFLFIFQQTLPLWCFSC